jgi:excisionase family DNA binding protein
MEKYFKEMLKSLLAELIEEVISSNLNQQLLTKDEWFDVKEASDYLKLAVPTVYGLTSQKKIPFSKRGKKLYFRRSLLEEWLNGGHIMTGEEIEMMADSHLAKKLGGRNGR